MTHYIQKTNLPAFWEKRKGATIHSLMMELTERCTHNCIHCYINLPQNDKNAKRRELSTDEIKNILSEARSLGCGQVKFTGGEPLLRDDFAEIYLFARRLGLRVHILTNAALITPELVKLWQEVPPLPEIDISIYGMKKKIYETVTRNSGSFEKMQCGISLLLKTNFPFGVKGVLFPHNRSDIDEFTSWTRTLPWMWKDHQFPVINTLLTLRVRRDSEEKNDAIKKLRLPPMKAAQFRIISQTDFSIGMREIARRFMHPPGDKLFICGAGVRGGYVDAYGKLQTCLDLRHPDTIYDLKKGSLLEGFSRFFPGLRHLKTNNPDYLNRCCRCFLHGLCEMCPAQSWTEHGTLDTPVEYLCQVAHLRALELGFIEGNEKGWEVQSWQERLRQFIHEKPIPFATGENTDHEKGGSCHCLES